MSLKTKKPAAKTTTIGEYLLNCLHKHGVDQIFGVPGDYVLKFDKCIEQHPIQYINATRENTAGYMADAYARIRGLGVACITYGVGINIVNALAQAFVESSPLIVISGSASSKSLLKNIRLHHLIYHEKEKSHDNTQLEIFKHVTIGQEVLNDPKTAQKQIDSIIDLCLATKKPVYIELPCDQVDTPLVIADATHERKTKTKESKHLEEALEATSKVLSSCRRPFIWAGHEIQRFDLTSQLMQFAEKHQIPIATSLLGKGLIDERHPLSIGVYQGNMSRPETVAFINDCDCAIMLGLLLTDVDTGIFSAKLDHKFQIIANAELIEIDSKKFKNISLNAFINGLDTLPKKKFHQTFTETLDRHPAKFIPKRSTKITTQRIFECIQSHLQPNSVVFADIGDSLFGSSDLILNQDGFFACAHFGSLGFATPGSLGVQFADPEKRVFALVGDGAFQMTCTELSTAVRYKLDPIVILFNNHGYGTERPLLEGKYNDIQNWNYSQLPVVFRGGVGLKITTEEDMDAALKQALAQRGEFYILEVELEKRDFSAAMQRFTQQVLKG